MVEKSFQDQGITITKLSGEGVAPWLPQLAKLRIGVFRDYPYCYDGSLDYEKDYLAGYAKQPLSHVIALVKDGSLIGASTAIPLSELSEFSTPFEHAEMDVASIFYLGERMIGKQYRGHQIGRYYFQEQERFARENGFKLVAFCEVVRPPNDPRRPADYFSIDQQRIDMGYTKQPKLQVLAEWKEINNPEPVQNQMVFWTKHL